MANDPRSPTKRFSNRVSYYLKYRPKYPAGVLKLLQTELGLTTDAVIADIGSGTGFFSELFLANGNPTYCVEPNDQMRQAAEARLKHYANFHSIPATAEATTLLAESIDFVVAAQAAHWFNLEPTAREFNRILKPDGHRCLVWNQRPTSGSEFAERYESLLMRYADNYPKVHHTNRRADPAQFFPSGTMQTATLPNAQQLDLDGFIGRVISSSYAPLPNNPVYPEFVVALTDLFDDFAVNKRLVLTYQTHVYFA